MNAALQWFVLSIAAALLLRWWSRERAAVLLTVLAVVTSIVVTGVLPALIVALLWLASTLVGQSALQRLLPDAPAAPNLTASLFTGLALYGALFSAMTHWRINYAFVFAVLLLLPPLLALRRRENSALTMLTLRLLGGWHSGLRSLPYPLLVLMIAMLGFVGIHALYPTMTYDDLFLHLRLWSELDYYHRANFDFNGNVWAVAPFLVDLQHAVVSLLAGTDSRATLTLAWAALLLYLLWQLSARWVADVWLRALLMLLFASTPMLGNLLQTLQTELFMALLATAGMQLVLTPTLTWRSHELLGLLAIAALCCATKLPGAVLGLLLLAAAVVQLWSRPLAAGAPSLRWSWFAVYLLALAVLALHCYLNAWRLTGNPLFPLYNAVFKSPFFDSNGNMMDERWVSGFSLHSWWGVFFATAKHHEGKDYTAGFQYLLLMPLAVVACVAGAQRRPWLPVLIPLLGFGVVMFASLQYWRYLFPVLPLASLSLAALLPATTAPRWQQRSATFALSLPLLLNLVFYPGITWTFALSPLAAITADGRDRMVATYASETAINQWLNRTNPGLRVLYPFDTGYGASLHGTPMYANWYSPPLQAARDRIHTRDDLIRFFRDQQIDAVIWSLPEPMPIGSAKWQLGRFLSQFGFPELQINQTILYRIGEREPAYQPLFALDAWAAQASKSLPLIVTNTPQVLIEVDILRARAVRYRVSYVCDDTAGYFIAQLNWDNGTSYYRLLPCATATVDFQEAVPVPPGVTRAAIYLTTRERPQLTVASLALERL
ncbi:MAG TPA: hypothetical protein VMH83_08380 [Candidatus Acidoferrum sp.]|nr:hypothetical protein [Candidatus Acidoferrum sp.]